MQNEESNTALLPNDTAVSVAVLSEETEQSHSNMSQAVQTVAPATRPRRCPPEPAEMKEIARLGWELYEQSIRAQVEPHHIGKFMSIDVDTGEYAVSDDPLEAAHQLIDKNFHVRSYGLRIGFRAMYKI